ncbi:hypothetical protein H312_01125, partial [Anncaliia algerae PRA339]
YNILEGFLGSRKLPSRHFIFEFKRSEEERTRKLLIDLRHDNSPGEQIEFETIVEKMNFKIKRKISLIRDIKNVDIMLWFTHFETIQKSCNWNEEESLIALKNLILDPKVKFDLIKNDLINTKREILKLKFPSKDSNNF